MKKLIWLITILAAGLGGYWLGQRPNSPRIFEWMGRQVNQIETAGRSQWVGDTVAAGKDSAVSVFAQIRGDGAPEATAEPSGGEAVEPASKQRPSIPECW